MNCFIRRSIAALLVVSIASVAAPAPAQADIDARSEVRARLVSAGVNAADANARVAALTDDEAVVLAAQMDALPAGGNPMAALMGAMVLGAGVGLFLVALPFIVVGAIVIGAVKSARAGGGVDAAPVEDQGPQ